MTEATVHQAIAAVIGALPGIGKDQEMREGPQRYTYRSIEQVKDALKPLLAAHGVHYAPHRLRAVEDSTYVTRSGATWQRVRLTVRYRVWGPDGSWFSVEVRGEGTDSGDKATLKALTVAEKAMLIQVFCVADSTEDPDHHRGQEEALWPPARVKIEAVHAIEREYRLDPEMAREVARDAWAAAVGGVEPGDMASSDAIALVAKVVALAAVEITDPEEPEDVPSTGELTTEAEHAET